MQTAMTFRLSSEVADRNARLLAISFSREMLRWRVWSTPGTARFSLSTLGSLSSSRRRLIVCCLQAGNRTSLHRCFHNPLLSVTCLVGHARILPTCFLKHPLISDLELMPLALPMALTGLLSILLSTHLSMAWRIYLARCQPEQLRDTMCCEHHLVMERCLD
jgi:hypothetical protein